MEEKVAIIELEPSQWREYKKIRLESVKNEPYAFGPTWKEESALTKKDWIDRAKSSQTGKTKFFFAQVEKKIVGLIGILFFPHKKFSHTVTFVSFYVNPRFRRFGIGRALMQAAFAYLELDRPEIIKISLKVNEHQKVALAFYKKMGFAKTGVGHKEAKIGNKYYDAYLMEKFLKKI